MKSEFQSRISASIEVKQQLLNNADFLEQLEKFVQITADCLRNGGKILFCGNGGSAADAQHVAAELSGRFYINRAPYFAEALHVNSSYMTAVANDYGYDVVFERMVQAMGRDGDILVGISTSGNSENVLRAMKMAKGIGMHTVAWTGKSGGKMEQESDLLFNMPSTDTPRIQEAHIMLGHLLCEFVELELQKPS